MQDQEFADAWEKGQSMSLDETKRFAAEAAAEILQ